MRPQPPLAFAWPPVVALEGIDMCKDGTHFKLSSLKKVREAVDFYIEFAHEAREAFKLQSDCMSRWTFAAQEASVVQLLTGFRLSNPCHIMSMNEPLLPKWPLLFKGLLQPMWPLLSKSSRSTDSSQISSCTKVVPDAYLPGT